MARHQTVLQDTNKSFQNVHLWPKNYWILSDSLWNSTTVVILLCTHQLKFLKRFPRFAGRHQILLQDTNKSFQDVHLWPKNYWILSDSLWNSTTVVILLYMIYSICKQRAKVEERRVIWPRLWNFIERQLKLNGLLHPNEHPEKDLFASCKTTWWRVVKSKAFSDFKVNFWD